MVKKLVGAVVVLGLIGAGISSCGGTASTVKTVTVEKQSPATSDAAAPAASSTPKPKHSAKPKPTMTVSQEQAIQSAQSYLAMGGFSRAGLINQLSSSSGEGFPKADAIYAVDHVQANWNQEAVESAKSYLQMGGFSRAGLIEQLSSPSGEGFTRAQAIYAVNKVGL